MLGAFLITGIPFLLLFLGLAISQLFPEDWRLRSRYVVLRQSEARLAREVARVLRERRLRELTILAASQGPIGLIAQGSGLSPRLRTVRRRVPNACSYCAVESVVRRLPAHVLKSVKGGADHVVADFRQSLGSQPHAVSIHIYRGLQWSVEAVPSRSNSPRYEPAACPVHINAATELP
jgi:hypothetical protein